ncbi:WD40-repeat-containing domain protein [Catenaria anguillulae PL171]|uniref:WD40-repeat-containing domain protein n=1 Tax=Catenaria anguillulae PL171 TaxID=765915 RepID=A0A1Y2HSD4_9FUNG|nr:WD40-repeat-containing domain protein [Catenaria anguillulae PL171]
MLATVTRDSLRLWKPSAPTPPSSATSSAPAAAVANGNSTSEFQLAAAVPSHQACVGSVPNDSIKHISWGTHDPSLLCVTTAASNEILIYNVASARSPKLVDRISPLAQAADKGNETSIVAAHLLGPTNRLLLYATTSPSSTSSSLVHIFDRDTRQLQESYAPTASSSNPTSGSPSPTLTTLAHSHDFPNHSLIAVGTSAGDIYLIDRSLGTGDSTSFSSPFTGPITALAFSPASHTLLTAGDAHGTVAYWHLAPSPPGHDTRQPTATFQSAHSGPVTGICPSPINKIALISCGRDGCVVLYDSSNAKRIRAFNYASKYARDGFTCASFKSDGYSIALGVKGTGEVVVLDLRRPAVPVGVVGAGAGGEDVVGVGYAGPASHSSAGRGGDKSSTSRATKEAYDKLVKGTNAAGVAVSVRTGRIQMQPGTVANPAPMPTTSAPASSARPRVTLDAAAFSPVRSSSHQQGLPLSSPTSGRPSSFSTSRQASSSPIKSPKGTRTAKENESPLDSYMHQQHVREFASSPAPRRSSTTSARATDYASPSRAAAVSTSTSWSPTRDTYHDPRAGVANAHVYAMHPDDMHPAQGADVDQDNMDVDLATSRHVPPAHSPSPPRHAPPAPASRPTAASPSPMSLAAPPGPTTSSFSLALLHSAIDDAVAGLRDQLRTDIQNVHLELLRQFDQHRVEMAELVVQVAGVQDLVAENRRLRAEVERLRGGVPTAAAASEAARGGTGRWSTMGEGGVGAGGGWSSGMGGE